MSIIESQLVQTPVDEIINVIRECSERRRPIVPLVGAGLSADSGFPILRVIVRYLAKFHAYLKYGAYFSTDADMLLEWDARSRDKKFVPDDHLIADLAKYRSQPWLFVDHFGWPERFQLDQELLSLLIHYPSYFAHEMRDGPPPSDRRIDLQLEEIIRKSLDEILTVINPTGVWYLKNLEDELQDKLTDVKADSFREVLHIRRDRASRWFDIIGDWKKLIQYFTNYQGDHVDALIARYSANRQPTQGHRFLAHLTRQLNIRTIMTYNFDTLIEESLRYEGMKPNIFSIQEGSGLPHRSLFQDEPNVIKLHGTNQAVLLNERVDHPLSYEQKKRFLDVTGPDPLLLVVGCSGGDYRLRDLVSYVVDRQPLARRENPAVIWLTFNNEIDEFIKPIRNACLWRVTVNPAATLQHIQSGLTGRHPTSAVPYICHVERPFVQGELDPSERDEFDKICKPSAVQQHLILSTLGIGQPEYPYDPNRYATHMLLNLAKYKVMHGFHIIWIDLEALSTLAEVVGAIIDQCRRYDTDLAPCVLPLCTSWDEELPWQNHEELTKNVDNQRQLRKKHRDAVVPRARDRVVHALRRAKYFIAFDSLQAFECPSTSHDGSTMLSRLDVSEHTDDLSEFLQALAREQLGESHLAISVDHPGHRHETGERPDTVLDRMTVVVQNLKKQYNHHEMPVVKPGTVIAPLEDRYRKHTKIDDENCFPIVSPAIERDLALNELFEIEDRNPWHLALPLLILSTFRRTRTHASLRWMLEHLFPNNHALDQFLSRVTDPVNGGLGMVRMEGGGVWYDRRVRDYIYHANSELTSTHKFGEMFQKLREKKDPNQKTATCIRETTFQLFAIASTHLMIARAYDSRAYKPSRDSFAYIEHLYHRVSGIRYLCKLLMLAQELRPVPAKSKFKYREQLLEGLQDVAELIRRTAPNRGREFITRLSVYDTEYGEDAHLDALSEFLKQKNSNLELDELYGKIVNSIASRHTRELRGLSRSWTLAEQDLRLRLPAEQLMDLTHWLLKDECRHRLNRVVVKYDLGKTSDNIHDPEGYERFIASETQKLYYQSQTSRVGLCCLYRQDHNPKKTTNDIAKSIVNTNAESYIEVLNKRLLDFRAKLQMDRTEYDGAIRNRISRLLTGISVKDFKIKHNKTELKELLVAIFKNPNSLIYTKLSELLCSDVCLSEQYNFLDLLLTPDKIFPKSPTESISKISQQSRIHYVIDIIVCLMKYFQHHACNTGLTQAMAEIEKLLVRLIESINKMASDRSDTDFTSSLFDARMRLNNLRVETPFRRISVFANDGFDGRLVSFPPTPLLDCGSIDKQVPHQVGRVHMWPPQMVEDVVTAADRITAAKHDVRFSERQVVVEPQSLIVDALQEGTIHPQYRSIFHMLGGRLEWLTCRRRDASFNREKFDAADRDFDLARSGLQDGNPLLKALIELQVVESCLVTARVALHPDTPRKLPIKLNTVVGKVPATPPADLTFATIHYIESRLDTAKAGLQRAREHLGESRRNVAWWRLYFHLVAQYYAERLMLTATKLQLLSDKPKLLEADDTERSDFFGNQLRMFTTRLRRAYISLRILFDYNFNDDLARQTAWSLRSWHEITLAAHQVANLALLHSQPSGSPDNGTRRNQRIIGHLNWFNVSAGLLPDSPIVRPFSELSMIITGNQQIDCSRSGLGRDHVESAPPTNQDDDDCLRRRLWSIKIAGLQTKKFIDNERS